MKRKHIFFCMCGFFILFVIGPSVSAQTAEEELPVKKAIQSQLDKAQRLSKRGNYTEAQKEYERMLENPDLDPEIRKEIKRNYEKVNYQLLFSRDPMPNSTFYIVVSGDSLYKIAKEHHTTVGLIKRMNALTDDTIYPGMKLKIITGDFLIRIDKSENVLELLLDEKPIKTYRVATGAGGNTPTGNFEIVNKLVNPTWFKAGAIIPPGSPDNILGTRWMGFDYEGYGIHGTTEPDSIGKSVSAGCVRMLNADVEEAYATVPVGTKVTVAE